MKTVKIVLILFLITNSIIGQLVIENTPLSETSKVDTIVKNRAMVSLGVNYITPVSNYKSNAKGGVGGTVDVQYEFYKDIFLGFEIDVNSILTSKDIILDGGELENKNMLIGLGSFHLKGTYLFPTKKVKPYISIGGGVNQYDDDLNVFDFFFNNEDKSDNQNGIYTVGYNVEVGLRFKNIYFATKYVYAGNRDDIDSTFLQFTVGIYLIDIATSLQKE